MLLRALHAPFLRITLSCVTAAMAVFLTRRLILRLSHFGVSLRHTSLAVPTVRPRPRALEKAAANYAERAKAAEFVVGADHAGCKLEVVLMAVLPRDFPWSDVGSEPLK